MAYECFNDLWGWQKAKALATEIYRMKSQGNFAKALVSEV